MWGPEGRKRRSEVREIWWRGNRKRVGWMAKAMNRLARCSASVRWGCSCREAKGDKGEKEADRENREHHTLRLSLSQGGTKPSQGEARPGPRLAVGLSGSRGLQHCPLQKKPI